MYNPTDRIAYTMAFVTPDVEHWLEQEVVQWVHMKFARIYNQLINVLSP